MFHINEANIHFYGFRLTLHPNTHTRENVYKTHFHPEFGREKIQIGITLCSCHIQQSVVTAWKQYHSIAIFAHSTEFSVKVKVYDMFLSRLKLLRTRITSGIYQQQDNGKTGKANVTAQMEDELQGRNIRDSFQHIIIQIRSQFVCTYIY